MEKQHLSERIMAIQQEMEQTKANYSKLEGHLNECTHWLQKMVEAEQAALKEAEQGEANDDQANEQGKEQAA